MPGDSSPMQIFHCAPDPSLVKGPIALGTRYRHVSRDDGGGGQGLLPQGLWLAFVSFVLVLGSKEPHPQSELVRAGAGPTQPHGVVFGFS